MSLSPSMTEALTLAKARRGRLYRWPGGLWVARQWTGEEDAPPPGEARFGATTIFALVDRGHLRVVARMGRGDAMTVEVVRRDPPRAFTRNRRSAAHA